MKGIGGYSKGMELVNGMSLIMNSSSICEGK